MFSFRNENIEIFEMRKLAFARNTDVCVSLCIDLARESSEGLSGHSKGPRIDHEGVGGRVEQTARTLEINSS